MLKFKSGRKSQEEENVELELSKEDRNKEVDARSLEVFE